MSAQREVGGDPLQEALAQFLSSFPAGPRRVARVPLDDALGRVTAEPVIATCDSPPFARVIVEGFLVNASDIAQASSDHPIRLTVAGVIRPGDAPPSSMPPGRAWQVFTGSAVPTDTCAVIRQWDAKPTESGDSIQCSEPLAAGQNIEAQGCDVRSGSVVVPQGTRIGPDEVGAIAAQGVDIVTVAAKPTVGIFGSGNEIVPHTSRLTPGAIWDCNTPSLSAYVRQEGGIATPYGVIRDDFDIFLRALEGALPHCGMLIIAGGTAVDGREFVRDLISALGTPGVVVNGVPMRSGKPLIMGVVDQTPIVCVAGHPPEALRGFRLFGIPALARLLGQTPSDHGS